MFSVTGKVNSPEMLSNAKHNLNGHLSQNSFNYGKVLLARIRKMLFTKFKKLHKIWEHVQYEYRDTIG